MPSPSRQTSTPPLSACTTSLPSPPDSSEKTAKAPSHLSSPALELIHDCCRGYPPDSQWVKIHLRHGDYEILQEQLREEELWVFVEDKIRYDWNPYTRELIYRMTTPVHDVFTARLVREIECSIDSIATRTDLDPHIPALASSIIHRSTSRIFLPGDIDDDTKGLPKHSPGRSVPAHPKMVRPHPSEMVEPHPSGCPRSSMQQQITINSFMLVFSSGQFGRSLPTSFPQFRLVEVDVQCFQS